MTRAMRWCALACMVWCVAGVPKLAYAQSDSPAGESRKAGDAAQLADQINNEIYSPFCPGKTLDMCPSPNAATVRRDIQKMSLEGYSREQIKTKVLSTYGEEFRIVEPPPSDNTGLLVALLVGLGLAVGVVVALSRRGASETDAPEARAHVDGDDHEDGDEDDAYLSALRDELEQ